MTMTFASTQQRADLAINIVVQDDNGARLIVLPLFNLVWLIMMVWSARCVLNQFVFWWHDSLRNLRYRIEVASKMVAIGFNSLAWGAL